MVARDVNRVLKSYKSWKKPKKTGCWCSEVMDHTGSWHWEGCALSWLLICGVYIWYSEPFQKKKKKRTW